MTQFLKRQKSTFLILLCVLAAVCLLVGCKKPPKPDETDASSVVLSAETLELELFESAELKATLSNLTGEVVWSTSQPGIADVDNGLVTACGIGSATITATVGDYSDSCTVTVERGTKNLSLDNLDLIVPLTVGTQWQLDLQTFLDGEKFDGAKVSVSTEGDYITLTETGLITAQKLGTQTIAVKATYSGLTLCEETVTVNVVEIAKIETGFGNTLELKAQSYMTETSKDHEKDLSSVKATINGQPVSNPLTFTSADSSVVAVENGKLVGKHKGTTTVKAAFTADSGNTYDTTFTVNVSNVSSTLTYNRDYAVSQDGNLTVSASEFGLEEFPTIDEVTDISGKVLIYKQNGEDLTVTTSDAGDVEFIVSAENVDYTVSMLVADYVLTDFADWYEMLTGGYKYMILENDITYDGDDYLYTWTANTFEGTFDGRGHKIVGAKVELGIVAYTTTNVSVMKNVTFEKLQMGGSYGSHGILGAEVEGTFENVHVTVDYSKSLYTHSELVVFATRCLTPANLIIKDSSFVIYSVPEDYKDLKIRLANENSSNPDSIKLQNVTIASVGSIAKPGEYGNNADGGTGLLCGVNPDNCSNVTYYQRSDMKQIDSDAINVNTGTWSLDLSQFGLSGKTITTVKDMYGNTINNSSQSGNTMTFEYKGAEDLYMTLTPSDGSGDVMIGVILPQVDLTVTYYAETYIKNSANGEYILYGSREQMEGKAYSTVNAEYNVIPGYVPNNTYNKEEQSAQLIKTTEDIVVKSYYDKADIAGAIPIAGTDGKGYLYIVDNNGNFGSTTAVNFTKQTNEIAGVANAYKITDNRTQYIRIVGVNSDAYTTLTFKIYADSVSDSNLTIFQNNAKGSVAASLNSVKDCYNNESSIRIFNENGVRMTAISNNQWQTVQLDIAGTGSVVEFYDSINCMFRLNQTNTNVYIADMKLSNDGLNEIDSPLSVSYNGDTVAYMLPFRFNSTGFKSGASVGCKSGVNDAENSMTFESVAAIDGERAYTNIVTTGTTKRLNHLVLKGIDESYIAANGITKLTFDFYVETGKVNFRTSYTDIDDKHCTVESDDSGGRYTFTDSEGNTTNTCQNGKWYKATIYLSGSGFNVNNWNVNDYQYKGLEVHIFASENEGVFRMANIELS